MQYFNFVRLINTETKYANKLENSDSPQVIMTPLISIANQWRVNSFMTFSNDDEIVYLIYSQ